MRKGRISPIDSAQRRRLLVLTFHFPPDLAVGGLRWAGLTKYLEPLGWQSWIITAGEYRPSSAHGDSVVVETSPPRPTINSVYRSFRQRSKTAQAPARSPAEPPLPTKRSSAIARAVGRLRTEVAAVIALMDEGQGTVIETALRARSLIDRVRPHAIISTGPPHVTHLSALLATRGRSIPWLVDLRDPFSGEAAGGARRTHLYYRSRIVRRTYTRLERLVFGAATEILTTTRELRDSVAERYPDLNVSWVPNGIDMELLPARSRDPFPGLALAHLGQIYGARNLNLVLRGLRLFLDNQSCPEAQESKLRVAGQTMATHAATLHGDIRELNLERHVELNGVLPRDEALEILARSNLAIVLAQDQPNQIPTKLYESVGMGIPTVVIAPRDSASGREASSVGAIVVEPDDLEGMLRALEGNWKDRRGDGPPPGRIHYGEIALKLEPILDGLTNVPTAGR